MPTYTKKLALTAASAFLIAGIALAQAQDRAQTQTQDQTQEQIRDRDIYGSQLMTPEERAAYHERMRSADTVEERERIRAEHHEQMQARAKERGLSLPDEPPRGAAGSMRPGAGGGPGMGGGRGRGTGGGRSGGRY